MLRKSLNFVAPKGSVDLQALVSQSLGVTPSKAVGSTSSTKDPIAQYIMGGSNQVSGKIQSNEERLAGMPDGSPSMFGGKDAAKLGLNIGKNLITGAPLSSALLGPVAGLLIGKLVGELADLASVEMTGMELKPNALNIVDSVFGTMYGNKVQDKMGQINVNSIGDLGEMSANYNNSTGGFGNGTGMGSQTSSSSMSNSSNNNSPAQAGGHSGYGGGM